MRYGLSSLVTEGTVGVRNIAYLKSISFVYRIEFNTLYRKDEGYMCQENCYVCKKGLPRLSSKESYC